MKRIGRMASYPPRIELLPVAINSIHHQLDELQVVLNEFTRRQLKELPQHDNVRYVIPRKDLKDTGKFFGECQPDDWVFLLDDDLQYPADYVETLIAAHLDLPTKEAVVGLHGVIYSDLFDGAARSRFVAKFDKALDGPLLVNQLGTGCSLVPGRLMPSFYDMASSQRFVDVRFARHCHQNGIAMVCLPRAAGWVRDLEPEDSIFESYTRTQHANQLEEIATFAGFGKLDSRLALKIEFG